MKRKYMKVKLRWTDIFDICDMSRKGKRVTDVERDKFFKKYGIKVKDGAGCDEVFDREKFSLFLLEYPEIVEKVYDNNRY